MIYINGHDLTIEQVIAVSRQGETVAIAPEARERINAARAYVDRKLADKAVVYGLTTGFGKFSTVFVPEEETAQLQKNLRHRFLIRILLVATSSLNLPLFESVALVEEYTYSPAEFLGAIT